MNCLCSSLFAGDEFLSFENVGLDLRDKLCV